jgi:oligosaccharyl transferase (archaeosortase A-associated)
MKPKKLWFTSPWLIVASLVVLFGIAFYLRVVLPYSQIFVGDWIKYTITDAYYFMRHVDNLVYNFPHVLSFDPFQYFPSGATLPGQNFFAYFVGTIAWLAGLGSPTQHTIDLVGVFLPPILGALTVVPVYFIGKILFNRWAGLLCAGMIAIMPGEFMGRTILANTDRDAFEVILSALTMLLFIIAIKSAREKHITFRVLRSGHFSLFSRPLLYSALLGIILGLFVLTWRGSFLFVLIILVYFVVQTIIHHFKRVSSEYMGFVCIIAFFIALIIFLIGSHLPLITAALILSLLIVVILSVLAWFLASKKANSFFYPLSILVLAAAGLGLFYAVSPDNFQAMVNQFKVFFPSGAELTISQMQPILFPGGVFSLVPVWGNFTTGNILIFFSLGILIYIAIKRDDPDKVLFLVWSILLLVATLLTRRIALLFALNVAILMGYFGWQIIGFMIKKTTPPAQEEKTAVAIDVKKKKKREAAPRKAHYGFLVRNRIVVLSLTGIATFFLIFFPSISPAIDAAKSVPAFAPGNNWYRALNWMKDNTPDPLGDPQAYYRYYSDPVPYPASAYGVASWWDFGYWIIRIAHRLPVSDPGGGAREQVARLFTSQNESAANQIVDQLQVRYLVIDDSTINTKFRGVTTYAGLDLSQFGETYYVNKSGTLSPVMLYSPEYYQCVAVRLYLFDGKKVTPAKTLVISYQDKVTRDGIAYKEVSNTSSFTNYDEAKAYIGQQKTGKYKIVSDTITNSPVPLEALQHYKVVYTAGETDSSTVKVFEYIK